MTDNYVLRLKPSAIKKILEELRQGFYNKVNYKGKYYFWNTILLLKTRELARYILGKSKRIDFTLPSPEFDFNDSEELRKKILALTAGDAKKIEINKSTLWDLKERAQSNKRLIIYDKIKKKLDVI